MTEGEFSPLELLALPISVALCWADVQSGHNNFTLNNLIATCIASDLLQVIGLRSFKAGAARRAGLPVLPLATSASFSQAATVLLVGMLVYDVVFGGSHG